MKQITRKLIEVGLAAIFSCSPLVAATTNNVAAATVSQNGKKKGAEVKATFKHKKGKISKSGVVARKLERTKRAVPGSWSKWTREDWVPSAFPDKMAKNKLGTQDNDKYRGTEKQYVVTYVDDSDLEKSTPCVVNALDYAPRPRTDPTRTGYVFDGWFTEEGTAYFFAGTRVDHDLTLYAHWSPL